MSKNRQKTVKNIDHQKYGTTVKKVKNVLKPSKNVQKPSKMSKNHQKPSKITKNRQKTVKNVEILSKLS